MTRIAYVNGRFVPHRLAQIHVEDRGFQFADGIYEVIMVLGGRLIDAPGHLDRLERSAAELKLPLAVSRTTLLPLIGEIAARNRVVDGLVYIQATRGVAPRDFKFPISARPTLVMTAKPLDLDRAHAVAEGVRVATAPDLRWQRRDIKSVGLLGQVLAKQHAAEQGAFEAWMVDPDGTVTEGSSSNAWIVTADGVIVTRPSSGNKILKGITRSSIMALAQHRNLRFEERPFTIEEAKSAREAFMTSATTICLPVTSIDGQPVGSGRPGPVAALLRTLYLDYAGDEAAAPIGWTPV